MPPLPDMPTSTSSELPATRTSPADGVRHSSRLSETKRASAVPFTPPNMQLCFSLLSPAPITLTSVPPFTGPLDGISRSIRASIRYSYTGPLDVLPAPSLNPTCTRTRPTPSTALGAYASRVVSLSAVVCALPRPNRHTTRPPALLKPSPRTVTRSPPSGLPMLGSTETTRSSGTTRADCPAVATLVPSRLSSTITFPGCIAGTRHMTTLDDLHVATDELADPNRHTAPRSLRNRCPSSVTIPPPAAVHVDGTRRSIAACSTNSNA